MEVQKVTFRVNGAQPDEEQPPLDTRYVRTLNRETMVPILDGHSEIVAQVMSKIQRKRRYLDSCSKCGVHVFFKIHVFIHMCQTCSVLPFSINQSHGY